MTNEKKKKKKNHVPFRLNILFLFVFLLFSVLILRLGVVQIVNGESYKNEVEKTSEKVAKIDAARGKMFDANGVTVVDNKAKNAITYTRTQATEEDHLGLAKELANFIDIKTEDLNERAKKDFWIAAHKLDEAYNMKLSESEIAKFNEMEDGDDKKYQLLLDRITKDDLSKLSKKQLEIASIYSELNSAMMLTPHYVKKGLTIEERARVGEHKESLNGIDLAVASERVYQKGKEFYYGNVDTIEREKLNYYLTRGYDRNDQAGISYLEKYYEDVLNGTKAKLKYVKNASGEIVNEPKRIEGSRGHDIKLTANTKFQHQIEKILEEELRQWMGYPGNGYLNDAYVAAVDPRTGGVLALAGREYKNGKMQEASYGTVLKAFAMGSTVKGATVLAGYETGSLPPGYISDKPITFDVGPNFNSYSSLGTLNVTGALRESSNVYMGLIAGNMAGFSIANQGSTYHANISNGPKFQNAFRTLREVYSQFGLGVSTGIDLPSESIGYEGEIPLESPGKIMQFAIGQYDTYTPIQMAQYVSTIANDGYRMKLHLMQSIHEPSSKPDEIGKMLYQYKPEVLNHITMSEDAIDTVQTGFRQVVTSGTADMLNDDDNYKYNNQYPIAGKTGTAQLDKDFDNDIDTSNSTFIGYAPYTSPEIALAVVVPGAPKGHVNLIIAGRVFESYYELTKE